MTPHLLAQGAVATLSPSVQLKRLTQQGVERLACAVDGGRVGGDGEGGYVAHLLQGTVALGGLVQQLVILQVLRQPLQHGNGLVEVHLQKAPSSVDQTDDVLTRYIKKKHLFSHRVL